MEVIITSVVKGIALGIVGIQIAKFWFYFTSSCHSESSIPYFIKHLCWTSKIAAGVLVLIFSQPIVNTFLGIW